MWTAGNHNVKQVYCCLAAVSLWLSGPLHFPPALRFKPLYTVNIPGLHGFQVLLAVFLKQFDYLLPLILVSSFSSRAYAGTPIEGWMAWEIQQDDPRTQQHKR